MMTVNGFAINYIFVVYRAGDAWWVCRLVSTNSHIFSFGWRCCHQLAMPPAHHNLWFRIYWITHFCIVICIFHCFRVCDVASLNCVQITLHICHFWLNVCFFVRQTYTVYVLGCVCVFRGPFIVCHYIYILQRLLCAVSVVLCMLIFSAFQSKLFV